MADNKVVYKEDGPIVRGKLPPGFVRISVAMAVYNAEKYIREMLDSIIRQLTDKDELVISYNASEDGTWDIISEYADKYDNVVITKCSKKGIIPNFDNAIRHCRGRYILLADQDDVWVPGKVEYMYNAFQKTGKAVILHDCTYVDAKLKILGKKLSHRGLKTGMLYNLVKNSYQGSCMGFKRSINEAILPIPEDIAMHDQWIGIIGDMIGGTYISGRSLLLYRQHGDNSSSDRLPILKKLKYMAIMFIELCKRDKVIISTKRKQRRIKNKKKRSAYPK